jgi:serine/threonine-protein kinase
MGEVVLAQHVTLRHTVAIKLLAPHTVSRQNLARFVREARVMVRLCSQHVARVLDIGTLESGLPYIVMEHLQGRDFGYLIEAMGRLTVEEAVTSVLQASKALAEAHALGIVHRDLKPSNLFLTQRHDDRWFVKVLDFGVSKIPEEQGGECITATADVFGTPAYMSPEQTRSAKLVDPRTDIWSLGLILAECLSGKPVYDGATELAVLTAIAAGPPPNLHLQGTGTPVELEAVIRRCLRKNPDDRYQNVEELARDLMPFAPGSTYTRNPFGPIADAQTGFHEAATRPMKRSERPSPAPRRTPKRAAWMAAAILPLVLGASLLPRPRTTDMSASAAAATAPPGLDDLAASEEARARPAEPTVAPPVPPSSDMATRAKDPQKKPGPRPRDARGARQGARPDGLQDRK